LLYVNYKFSGHRNLGGTATGLERSVDVWFAIIANAKYFLQKIIFIKWHLPRRHCSQLLSDVFKPGGSWHQLMFNFVARIDAADKIHCFVPRHFPNVVGSSFWSVGLHPFTELLADIGFALSSYYLRWPRIRSRPWQDSALFFGPAVKIFYETGFTLFSAAGRVCVAS